MKGILSVYNVFILFLALSFPIKLLQAETIDAALNVNKIYHLKISGSINPAVYNYLKHSFEKIEKKTNSVDTPAVIIQMNTPGGLVSTTKDILTLFGKYPWPILVWVGPEGASATSAGAFISAAAHVLLMAPGTNIGAATPITMSGDLPKDPRNQNQKSDEQKKVEQKSASDVRAKAMNDLMALVRSLSQARGRNSEAFEEMISKASSFTANEAINNKIAEKILHTVNDLPQVIHQMQVIIRGEKRTLITSQAKIEEIKMSLGDKFLNILSHPQTAYLLFLLGAALLYFEFQSPGGFIAGSLGVICLLFAAFAFQVLPLNMIALLFIVASFAFFILEIYITSYGMLSLVGLASLIFGSLFLFDTDDSLLEFHWKYVASTVSGVIITMGLMGYYLWTTRRKDNQEDFFVPINKEGVVIQIIEEGLYQVKVGGEMWKAKSNQDLSLQDKIQVTGSKSGQLLLEVQKK
jgi:membrane-bound serine protease (ClpP class)